jgi:predicted nucleic acid-binding protein
VSASREIVVQDACVIFDLIDLGLIHTFFDLPVDVYTTHQVIEEIDYPIQLDVINNLIADGKLLVKSDGSVSHIYAIVSENSGLSFADGSVLELAIRVNGVVLSSDMKLRNATVRNSLTVRGVLWVIEELQRHSLLSTEDAIEKLSIYEYINDRAPRTEIRYMIERLMATKE